ncbi:MAG: endonuclease MutS2, partial [Cyanobacteriota bacterium]
MIETETLELLEWQRLGEHLATFTSTKLGARAARNLPIPRDRETSLTLLTETKEVYQLEQDLTTGWKFDGIYDFGSALERAEYKGILPGETLVQIASTLMAMRRLRRVIDDLEESPRLKELISQVRTYPELEQEINRCVDEKGKVTERASPKLGEIRAKIKQWRDRAYQKLQNIIQRQGGAVQEPVITQRNERFVIPVKAGQKEAIPGIVHDSSSSGATLYIEPHSVVELGNQQRQYIRQEQREEERILQALTEQVGEIKDDLELLLAIATKLDLATARARYSLWLEANPPRFVEANSEDRITLRRLRHPLLVWQQHHEQGTPVVPIDVQITPETRVVAITGPNTGGKTVTLKTVGLAALMAKVGLFIPAKEPVEIPWFEQVLADIGDEQSLEQSLSTFSGHIRRITRIISAINAQNEEEIKPS